MNEARQKLEWELCRRDAHAFIFGVGQGERRRSFLYTKDEHEIENPVQPFPDELCLRVILDLLLVSGKIIVPSEAVYADQWRYESGSSFHLAELYESGLLTIEKSRQVMITWLCLAYVLWRAKFREHQLILVQSKREPDAQKLVCVKENEPDGARLTFMESHLPLHLQNANRGGMTKCNVYFESGSHVWGIPQGGGIIRGNTPSVLFSDECGFQPEFGEAYRASLPAIRGGGQAIFVSSAEVGEFQQLLGSE